jgi:hypothetical protein
MALSFRRRAGPCQNPGFCIRKLAESGVSRPPQNFFIADLIGEFGLGGGGLLPGFEMPPTLNVRQIGTIR